MNPFPIVLDALTFALLVPVYIGLVLVVGGVFSTNKLEQDK